MAKKDYENPEYDALRADLSAAAPRRFYLFHGEERYLLERCAAELRALVLTDGEQSFNYSRFETMPDANTLREAVETYPFFAERTLVEVFECDLRAVNDLLPLLRDLPEHVCLVFIGNDSFKLDKRTNAVKELSALALTVEFRLQEQSRLIPWIRRHFKDAGRQISPADAEYLAFLTDGMMANLVSEIGKIAAHTTAEIVTRADIDALVAPTPNVELYKLTDAILSRNFRSAASVLSTLFAMREAPHKINATINARLRALLLARLFLDERRTNAEADLMKITGTRFSFQAKSLFDAARRMTAPDCKAALSLCCDAAFALNDDGGGNDSLTDLLIRLAALKNAA